MITGIARIFLTGGQSEGVKRPGGGRVPPFFWGGRLSCGYNKFLTPPSNVLLSDQRGNGGAWVLVPRSYASRVTVVQPGFVNVGPKRGSKRPSVGQVCVCVGGGGIPLPHGREIFEIICIQIAFFGTLKDLLQTLSIFVQSLQSRGRMGSCTPLSYASDSGVARICQRGEK